MKYDSHSSLSQSNYNARHVCIIGIGGVGTWVAEALARSGVGHLTLVDLDEICVTNINRQLHSTFHTVGQSKVHAMAQRLSTLNPAPSIYPMEKFFTSMTADIILSTKFDCVIDAIDSGKQKVELIARCLELDLPIIVSGGAGGRRQPAMVRVKDLSQSTHDGLLRRVKRGLRKKMPHLNQLQRWHVPTVFSAESPVFPMEDGSICLQGQSERTARRLDCRDGFGAASFITGTFGLRLADQCLKTLDLLQ